MPKTYKDVDDAILCTVCRFDEWEKGLNFFTTNEEAIQVGTWFYDKDKKLARHKHRIYQRETNRTMECIVVLSGSVLVKLYDDEYKFVSKFMLKSGDFSIFFRGGHEYEICDNETRVIETKNGPFTSAEYDKELF